MTTADAIATLRKIALELKPGVRQYDEIVKQRDEVFARFRPIFSLDHIGKLTRDEYTPFLYLENNHHWSNLYRTGLRTANDMPKLRKALALLLDEKKPIDKRFTESLAMIDGFGKGIATAVLTVAYPDRYGVWNNTSEAGLRQLGLWPELEKGLKPGAKYERVNQVLVGTAAELGLDLWTLDALWWVAIGGPMTDGGDGAVAESVAVVQEEIRTFALEQQLEKFLVENWEKTSLGKEWEIHAADGEPLAGNQFPTEVGRIDILARHRKNRNWLVIELKRNQSNDQTIAQALRYLAWVKRNLAGKGESVEALIVAHTMDKQGAYALTATPGVRAMLYQVEFRLSAFDPEALITPGG
jgi:hypothetical protein